MRTMSFAKTLGLALAVVLAPASCTSRLGPVRATQNGGIDHPNLPDIAVEHARECVAEYATQLPPGRYALDSNVEVNEDGDKVDVTIDGIPNTAPDFAACMRNVLRDMPIAEEPFREGVAKLKHQREQLTTAQKSLMGSPIVIVVAGVAIVVGELALEAGAYTILFAVTVTVVDKAAKNIAEVAGADGWKAQCAAHYAACMATSAARKSGNHWRQSRCGICARVCISNEGSWPSEVGNGSCEYWQGSWN